MEESRTAVSEERAQVIVAAINVHEARIVRFEKIYAITRDRETAEAKQAFEAYQQAGDSRQRMMIIEGLTGKMPKYFNLLPEVISAQAKAREAEQALAQVDPKTEEDQIEDEKPLTDRPLPEENARRVAIAQKILFPVLKAAGIEVPVGMDIFQNDQTLIAWLTQDVFVAGEQKDPVQMMILAFIHEVYGLPEMKLREGVTFAACSIEVVARTCRPWRWMLRAMISQGGSRRRDPQVHG